MTQSASPTAVILRLADVLRTDIPIWVSDELPVLLQDMPHHNPREEITGELLSGALSLVEDEQDDDHEWGERDWEVFDDIAHDALDESLRQDLTFDHDAFVTACHQKLEIVCDTWVRPE